MNEKKLEASTKRRCVIAILIFLIFVAGLVLRLMNFQLVRGKDFLVTSDRTTVKTIPIEAPRGEILDTNGRALAVNRTVYCIRLDLVFMPKDERNDIILRLIGIMYGQEEEYYDELPVTQDFPYSFTDSSEGLYQDQKSARARARARLGEHAYQRAEKPV